MPSALQQRIEFLKAAQNRLWVRCFYIVIAVIGFWDLVGAQFVPQAAREKWPTIYDLAMSMNGLLPWWGWIIGVLLFALVVTIEYAVRKNGISSSQPEEINDNRINKEFAAETSAPEILEFVAFGTVVKISAEILTSTTGRPTKYVLYRHLDGEKKELFEELEGHTPTLFAHDFDGDGNPELVVTYHCGAHTKVLNVYKLQNAQSKPQLIPDASIGSDWPEIWWGDREDGPGVLIRKKDRNWTGEPTQEFVTEEYVFDNGRCVKVNAPVILAELETTVSPIGDFRPACAIRVTNTGPELEGKCLAQIENHELKIHMPDPFVVRTEGQIRGKRTGRFTLSTGQSKLIPLLYREPARLNQFRFIGEDGKNYSFAGDTAEFDVSIYGAGIPTRLRIRLSPKQDGGVNFEMEYC